MFCLVGRAPLYIKLTPLLGVGPSIKRDSGTVAYLFWFLTGQFPPRTLAMPRDDPISPPPDPPKGVARTWLVYSLGTPMSPVNIRWASIIGIIMWLGTDLIRRPGKARPNNYYTEIRDTGLKTFGVHIIGSGCVCGGLTDTPRPHKWVRAKAKALELRTTLRDVHTNIHIRFLEQ